MLAKSMRTFFPGVTLALVFAMDRSKKLITPSLKYHHRSVISSTAVQIFKPQEALIVSSDSTQPSAAIADLAPTFTSTNQYTWSAWFYQTFWGEWGSYVVIALDPAYSIFFRGVS